MFNQRWLPTIMSCIEVYMQNDLGDINYELKHGINIDALFHKLEQK